MNKFLKILTISVIFLSNFIVCDSNIQIEAIRNLAAYKIFVASKKMTKEIDASTCLVLSSPFQIPFISINKYMTQFVKNTPYVPEKALKIKTKLGYYYIWRSEHGVVSAPDPKSFDILEQWKTCTLLDNIESSQLLKLLLLVDHKGKISLQNFNK